MINFDVDVDMDISERGMLGVKEDVNKNAVEPLTQAVYLDVVRYTPVNTGDLVSHIRVETVGGEGRISVSGFAGAKMMWIEYGTPAHTIRPNRKRVLANRATGQIYGKLVHHPGTEAQFPMRRATYKRRSL